MKTDNQNSETPFWEDEYAPSFKGVKTLAFDLTHFLNLFRIITYLFIGLFAIFFLYFFRSSLFSWILATFLLFSILFNLYVKWLGKSRKSRIGEIQKRALEITNASIIGSAIHVAGHPLLERDQPIVMALVNDYLNIYNYNDSTPLDRIPISVIISVKTIVYDEDRIPHSDIIDSAAQALKLNFTWQGNECTVLLRRMKKVRPIDWYHSIQRARLNIEK